MKTEILNKQNWAFIVLGFFILSGLYLSGQYNYLLFHSLVAISSVVIACGIFMVTWDTRKFSDNNYFLFLGIAYLFVAVLDLTHTLACPGMNIFKGNGINPAPQVWIAARYLESLSLLVAPVFFNRKLKTNQVLIAYAAGVCIIFLSIFLWQVFPACSIAGIGPTLFKKISESLIALILLGAIAVLFQNRQQLDANAFGLLVASLIISACSELAFAFIHYAGDFSSLVGHYLKLIAVYLIYKAVIKTTLTKPYNILFKGLVKSKEDLSAAEFRFRQLYENAPLGYQSLDEKGRFVEVNQAWLDTLGYARKEVIGKFFTDFLAPGQTEVFKEKFLLLNVMGEISGVECEIVKQDGSTILGSFTARIDQASSGNFRQTFGIFSDITTQRKAEIDLQESEGRYRSMMEAMGDDVYICSPDFYIEYMNPSMINRIGHDAVGELCHKVFYGSDKKCSWCFFEKVLAGEHVAYEHHDSKTGRYYLINCSPVNRSGVATSKLSIFRDISELKQMEKDRAATEAKLHQAQKMEAIGTLAGGIAHDFNNILSSIIGYTELSIDDVEKGSLLEENFREVLNAGFRARDLVKQILTFARQTDEETKPVMVKIMAKEAMKLLRASIPATIEIHQQIQSDSLIMGDPTQVHQIFMNLCTNAAHAMEEDGGVLEVGLIDIALNEEFVKTYDTLKPGDYMKLWVSDTGTGIAPDILGNIFEPYFTTKAQGKGTGMGLSMVHGIVSGYGGEITVESVPGQGTAFTVYLPVIKKYNIPQSSKTMKLPTGTEKILCVDDELPIAKMNRQVLEGLGYSVTVRTSSIEALELFRLKPDAFDLVITDMTMPNMTGDKLAVEVMDIRPDFPIILCTGYSNRMSEETADKLGIRAYLHKPVNKADLAQMVRKVLDNQ